jgi:hypothetical protein
MARFAGAGARRSSRGAVDRESLRKARIRAKQRIAGRGITYRVLRGLTVLAMLDVRLMGRIPAGPFFALLVKEKTAE